MSWLLLDSVKFFTVLKLSTSAACTAHQITECPRSDPLTSHVLPTTLADVWVLPAASSLDTPEVPSVGRLQLQGLERLLLPFCLPASWDKAVLILGSCLKEQKWDCKKKTQINILKKVCSTNQSDNLLHICSNYIPLSAHSFTELNLLRLSCMPRMLLYCLPVGPEWQKSSWCSTITLTSLTFPLMHNKLDFYSMAFWGKSIKFSYCTLTILIFYSIPRCVRLSLHKQAVLQQTRLSFLGFSSILMLSSWTSVRSYRLRTHPPRLPTLFSPVPSPGLWNVWPTSYKVGFLWWPLQAQVTC